ncbi:uncharacterized protein LOC142235674 [Haematobia irritans]|uniref:uncharacterized protein LOC142235674 n=1 Tax=Haematobia irritans TaxID=7368 RepID=UPI003F4F4F89
MVQELLHWGGIEKNKSKQRFKRKTTSHDEIFIDFMEDNKDLAMGFTKRDKVVQDKLWSDLADKLNSCGPHRRGVSEWRKTWTDWKRDIKTKICHSKSECRKTGGGQFNKYVLSSLEERVAVLCGLYVSVDGIKNAKTFGANKENEKPCSSKASQNTVGRSDSLSTTESFSPTRATESPLVSCDGALPQIANTPKRRKMNDVDFIMTEESRNFKTISDEIKSLRESIEEDGKCLRSIDITLKLMDKKMDALIALKKEEVAELKRHHIRMEQESVTRNKLKLKSVELEQYKASLLVRSE